MNEGEMFIIIAHKILYPSRRSFLNICLNCLRDITFLSSLGIVLSHGMKTRDLLYCISCFTVAEQGLGGGGAREH